MLSLGIPLCDHNYVKIENLIVLWHGIMLWGNVNDMIAFIIISQYRIIYATGS